MKQQIFVSYAHKDSEICAKICELLRSRGIQIWHDEEGLPPEAEDFNIEIEEAIDTCPFFLCVWTSNIKLSDYCRKELERAFEWKSREPDKRSIFILKMESDLDNLTDLPKGCNIHCTGDNFKYAYTDNLLEKSIDDIVSYLYKNKIKVGMSKQDAVMQLPKYISQEFNNTKNCPNTHSRIVTDSAQKISIDEVLEELIGGKNFQIEGARGSGKSLVLINVHRAILNKLQDDLSREAEYLYVPIYAKMEHLWDMPMIVLDALFSLCTKYGVPYCTDPCVRYVIILDGNLGMSRGNVPDAVNKLINPQSGVYSKILGHCNKLILPSNYKRIKIQLLSYADVVNYVVGRICDQKKVSNFFYGLYWRSFEGCGFAADTGEEYFSIIKRIYNIFKNDSLPEKGGSLRTNADGFYDYNLATTTQKGRLPGKLGENDRFVWKKLIRGNEVFLAIRNPYYLEWLVKLFCYEKEFVFPYKLKTLQVMICKKMLSNMGLDQTEKEILIEEFLHPLALEIEAAHSRYVGRNEFRKKINSTDFEYKVALLVDAGIIIKIGDDIAFAYDFLADYFSQYTQNNNALQLETNLRVCKSTQLVQNYIAYIQLDEPYKQTGVDSFEAATRIIRDERESFDITEGERQLIYEIAQKRIDSAVDFKQKASILDGVGLLFNDLTLVVKNQDLLDIKNTELWNRESEYKYVMRHPITQYHYQLFVKEGYVNEKYWQHGTSTLLLKDGTKRKQPIAVDSSTECVFGISNHPKVGITWYEAKAFCAWLEERIAARLGVAVEASLPSIDDMSSIISRSIQSEKYFSATNGIPFQKTTPVGLYETKESAYSDIIGNVWEWSSTGYKSEDDWIMTCYGGCWGRVFDSSHYTTTYPARLSSNNVGFRIILKIIT